MSSGNALIADISSSARRLLRFVLFVTIHRATSRLRLKTINALIQRLPHLQAIVTTGEKATETICAYFDISESPKVNASVVIPELFNRDDEQILLYRLPSSSRAYPLSFDKKVDAYRSCFNLFLD